MKCTIERGGVRYEFDADSPASIHDKMAAIESVVYEKCGECDSDDIAREVFQTKDGKIIRKLKCRNCSAALDVVENKSTRFLFAGRKNVDGQVKGTRGTGWEIYQARSNRSDAYSEPASNAPPVETTDQGSIPF